MILLGGSTYVLCSIDERLERAGRELPPADDANRPAAQSAAATVKYTVSPSVADPFEAGRAAYRDRDYETALRFWGPRA